MLAALLLAGCQTAKTLYYWGNYEEALYKTYRNPAQTDPSDMVMKLEQDLAKAAAKNMQPNPGLHAQLGYAYFQLGKFDAAKKEFETEKALYPESAVFIDRMLAKFKEKTTS